MKKKNYRLVSAVALSMLAAIPVSGAPKVIPFQFEHQGYISQLSFNANWAVAVAPAGNTFSKTQIVDVMNGRIIDLPTLGIIDADGDEYAPDGLAPIRTTAVSEDGDIIGGSYDGLPGYWKENKWHLIEFPNGRRQPFLGHEAEVLAVRAGGKYMVGRAWDSAFNIKPILWIDGKIVDLPNLPKRDWKGYYIDLDEVPSEYGEDHDYRQFAANMSFLDITKDGKYLLAGMSTNHPGWGSCYFIYNLADDTYKFIGTEELNARIQSREIGPESELCGDNYPRFSENGHWIAGDVMILYENGSEYGTERYMPFVYDVEASTINILEEASCVDVGVTGITNEGKLVGVSSRTSPDHSVVFRNGNGNWYSLENILTQTYNLDFTHSTGYDALSGTAWGISTDGKRIVAMPPGSRAEAYMVSLDDKDFFSASDNVNLLYNCGYSPAEYSSIAVFNDFYLAFETNCEPISNAGAELRDSEDRVIARSRKISHQNGDGRFFKIEFEPTDLRKGEKYYLVVPAGQFEVASTGDRNNEIKVAYTGRATEPLAPKGISPRTGSAVQEIGFNNVVSIAFETTVQSVAGKYGYLYQEGLESPITSLVLASSGNTVAVYPAASRKLMQGTNYRIEIPAGSIVDITGYCPNETIEINYSGAYTIPAPDMGSTYLFYDDFDDPNESLSKFMLYEGDHNVPVSSMTALGFDKDNTPWNFSVRESSESSDFVAASHSMYNGGGKSNDWMVTPQLNVGAGNESYTLHFQGQGYNKSSKDFLKIIVWECDEVFNSLSSDVVSRIAGNGDVVFNERLLPGASQEDLEGEWTDYSINLDAYKGKNIYVAFVNENNNQSMIFINNVNVLKIGNYQAAFAMPEIVFGKESIEVKASVKVTGDQGYDSLAAVLKNSEGNEVSRYEASGLALSTNDVHTFSFPEELPLLRGIENKYSMTILMGEEEQQAVGSIKALTFEPTKRVVLEEGTGAWCGNCPTGILAIEHLEELFPQNFIPISIHNGDTYAYPAYESFLGFSAFPTGRVNRLEPMLAPYGVAYGALSFESETGYQTFKDFVLKELEVPAIADIDIESADFNGESSINVTANVKFAIDTYNINYNIFTLLLEDNLIGLQTNYFSGNTNPFFGEWGTGSLSSARQRVNYADVARGIAGVSFHGENGYIPVNVQADVEYTADIELPVPKSVANLGNCKVVCILIDASTGYVVNAAKIDGIGELGSVSGPTAKSASIEFSEGTFLIDGSKEGVAVFTLQGNQVYNENLAPGLYIVRGYSAQGPVSAKIMAR